MEPQIDYSRALPSEIWDQILACLDPLFIEHWCLLMLVSRFWRQVVSRQARRIVIHRVPKATRATVSLRLESCANLRAVRLLPPSTSQSSRNVYSVDLKSVLMRLPLLELVQLEEFSLVGSEWSPNLDLFLSHSRNFPNLRTLSLSGASAALWPAITAALQDFPNLRELCVSSVLLAVPSGESLVPVEQATFPCLEALQLDSIEHFRNFSAPHLTRLSLSSASSESLSFGERHFTTLFCVLESLEILDLSGTKVETAGATLSPGNFGKLHTLVWNHAKSPIHLSFLFELPSLTKLETIGCDLVSPPPPPSTTSQNDFSIVSSTSLRSWTLSPNSSRFTFAVLQLVPNLVQLHVTLLYANSPHITKLESFLNSLSAVSQFAFTEDLYLSDNKISSFVSRMSFGNRLTSLNLSSTAVKGYCLKHFTTYAPHISSLKLRKCEWFLAEQLKQVLLWTGLTELDLSGTQAIRTTDLSNVIAKISTLTNLRISHIENIWTPHLRLLEPLRELRRLEQVLYNRGNDFASFGLLKGLWPKLTVFVLEPTSYRNLSILAESFGPLVDIIHQEQSSRSELEV